MKYINNIAIFIPGRLYRNHNEYDFTFLQNLITFYNSNNISVTIFSSLSKNCEIPMITKHFQKSFDLSDEQLNIEDIIVPSIIYNFQKRPETNYDNAYKMFYHNYKCFELINQYSNKHNIKFDIIMKWRTDINVTNNEKFYKNSIQNFSLLTNETLYIPSQDLFWGISDQLAYGNFQCMKQYCLVIKNIISLCKSGIIYHPETLLNYHCLQNNLQINLFYINYNLF